MKVLVIYDSRFGNTQTIAEAIAHELEATVIHVAKISHEDLVGYDLLVVGSPINGWRPSQNMKKFLSSLKKGQLSGMKATAFDTRVKIFLHGNAANRIAKRVQSLGAEIIAKPEGFYVKGKNGPLLYGEIERAKE